MMDNSENSNGIAKLQKIDLDIAKEFASLCDRFGLKYYMLGGTMLGAIRHKGFIPWDDDMDFGMFREDYEKFQEIAPKELPYPLELIDYRHIPDCHCFSRVVNTDVKIIEEYTEEKYRNTFASIDIFPIDGSPNISLLRKFYFFRVLLHRAMMVMCSKEAVNQKRERGAAEKWLIFVLGKLPLKKFTSSYKQKTKIDKIMKKQKVQGSKYIGNLMGYYRSREVMPSEFYGEGEMYPFEDVEFRGQTMFDEYLTWQYGNYMQLPPVEEREKKTHYKIVEGEF